MGSCKLTPFGLCVKTELLRRGERQEWLIQQIKEDTGMYVDSSYLNKIFTGYRSPEEIVNSIKKILDITETNDSTSTVR